MRITPLRRRLRHLSIITLTVFLLWGAKAPTATAHPLGNFTVNRYSRLALQADQVLIYYIIDHAEIPALAELLQMDTDGDQTISAVEEHHYLDVAMQRLTTQLAVTVNGVAQPLTPQAAHLDTPLGEESMPTLRLEFELTLTLLASADGWELQYRDNGAVRKGGWQEIIVTPTADVTLLSSTAPTHDVTNALRNYPAELLNRPVWVREATVRFALATAPGAGVASSAATTTPLLTPTPTATTLSAPGGVWRELTTLEKDRFAELISRPLDGPWAVLLLLLAAFGWGGLHALSPGHGKTIVAAYLVGSRGTPHHALLLGLTTTITHTLGVFALGLITLFISTFILPEVLYPWLGVLSGALVAVVGFTLLRSRWRGWRHERHHQHGAHHEHHHDHHHEHASEHGHSHLPPVQITWRNLLALGISGGLLPCPSALVVMLGAIALGRIGFGLLLILIFSLGLATVLTVTGLLFVYAGRLFARLPVQQPLFQLLPLCSALLVTLLGLGITINALLETGVLSG